ncbi:hypothetical protein [Maritimibacter sp. DP1N21-5]|uniref:hypothetical protein n=1 Tax=Maritimibacter sp. DP1N21-5 TaxID=2836867 RepID=UPI001C481AEC|nr:hypothetical protein [Maritimibacter sp. DP1N21-5]MBV7410863.1 hypothetical protein [Maritimibacter sp. DP1N21-5]
MTDVQFGRLVDLPLRDAWKHEAHQFTPWLAQNIDHLAAAIGVTLELTGTEVAVESFSADILARNPVDDTVVLIENQLEATDHTHLGQIMTYLAGLEAQTVVWIAPSFREPHLAAIRWLNEHTADGFSFFAVKARVVRIGDSPFAPIFEVVEKPNDWQRKVQVQTQPERSALSKLRADFWAGLIEAHPDLLDRGFRPSATSSVWLPTAVPKLVIGLYVAGKTCGIYLRSDATTGSEGLGDVIAPALSSLSTMLSVPAGIPSEAGWYLPDRIAYPLKDSDHWPDIWAWMARRVEDYSAAIADFAAGQDL